MAFPAYAGMFPHRAAHSRDLESFPRVCGDVSILFLCDLASTTLSPRMRGCFLMFIRPELRKGAFPAYAGMFPKVILPSGNWFGFPRVCGDVSL